MEKDQELEWAEAQKIAISVDLVAAAKQLLRFLAEIDRNRSLYDGHALDRAIYRLNPGCYKADCKELYGRILDNQNVISSTRAICRKQTEEIWKRMYPDEPYELNTITHFLENVEDFQRVPKSTEYDLISAVKRQSLFFYQVSRFHMNGDLFLEEAVASGNYGQDIRA
ncbi:Uncharacterized protein TCM_034563 [Theobroma cacao]|uniref:Uncharacterized protein n=1 Tax=Theobroma cacao TaxID=3641 RepID=A0A061FM13_THECC|nr:Uncharacterized protein TCM_034563 [Theobroma cacao]